MVIAAAGVGTALTSGSPRPRLRGVPVPSAQ